MVIQDEGKETGRAEPWLDIGEKLTEFVATDQIEARARQTGVVRRTSKITGKIFLALRTGGAGSTPKTSWAQLAAKGAPLPPPVDLSPEARQQRRTRGAVAFLRARLQRAFAQLQTEDTGCDAEVLAPFPAVPRADSTGFALPNSLTELFPGSGGGASTAGAKIHLVGEYLSPSFAHLALVAGTMPDNQYSDTGVKVAQRGALLLFALGSFKSKALAPIAEAAAYFLTRHTPQAALFEVVAGRLRPGELAAWLRTAPQRLVEKPRYWGARERVTVRLGAARVPEAGVTERRRKARAKAKNRGYPPSQAPLSLLAGNLFLTPVPRPVWTPAPVCRASALRGQVDLGCKSWKSSLPLAALPPQLRSPPSVICTDDSSSACSPLRSVRRCVPPYGPLTGENSVCSNGSATSRPSRTAGCSGSLSQPLPDAPSCTTGV